LSQQSFAMLVDFPPSLSSSNKSTMVFKTAVLLGATKRPLTPKHGNKNYYKGRGSGATGVHRRDNFIIQEHKQRTFVVPNLQAFPLTPYVSPQAERPLPNSHTLLSYFKDTINPVDNLALPTTAHLDPVVLNNCQQTSLDTLARVRTKKI
jgi:large subunit ribosomal protein L41